MFPDCSSQHEMEYMLGLQRSLRGERGHSQEIGDKNMKQDSHKNSLTFNIISVKGKIADFMDIEIYQ